MNRSRIRHIHIVLCLFALIISASYNSCGSNVEPDTKATVYVKKTDNGYILMRNGEPFLVKGVGGHEHLKALKEAGANTFRLYDTVHMEKYLDEAAKLDLAVIVDIPLPYYKEDGSAYSDKMAMDRLATRTRSLVKKYKNHPALLCWFLGNEVNNPVIWKSDGFYEQYNSLLDIVHSEDPNHPVSTALVNIRRKQLLSFVAKSPKLDFISFNAFGGLKIFEEQKESIAWLWDGPYLISEWGINGPWEADVNTSWSAPVEPTSTKKAEQLWDRYTQFIEPLDDSCLGNLYFFWGQKQETTSTWFSTFSKEGDQNELAYVMQHIWNQEETNFNGPRVDYMLLNGQGAADDIFLSANTKANATLKFLGDLSEDYQVCWEIRPEAWYYLTGETQYEAPAIGNLIKSSAGKQVTFNAPKAEGPYRLYAYVTDSRGNFATANTPFYVLNPVNEQ